MSDTVRNLEENEYLIECAKAMGRADGQYDGRHGYTPEHSQSHYRFREIEGGDKAKQTYNDFYQRWRTR